LRPGLGYAKCTSFKIEAIQTLFCIIRIFLAGHLDKTKTFTFDYLDVLDGSVIGE